jgi:REP element-mobilizing transposase RayT
VVARGNHQQRLFYTPQDYRFYLSLLQEAVERFGLRILAYALLPNHVHLLCRRGPVPLAKVMHHVQRRFAVHLNRRLGLRGHVFQDRYYARLCEDEEYLWAVVRYIHDNPVQAGLCDNPQAYPWSSGPEYATGGSGLVDREEVASLFGAPERVRDLPGKARSSPDRPKGINGHRSRQGANPTRAAPGGGHSRPPRSVSAKDRRGARVPLLAQARAPNRDQTGLGDHAGSPCYGWRFSVAAPALAGGCGARLHTCGRGIRDEGRD